MQRFLNKHLFMDEGNVLINHTILSAFSFSVFLYYTQSCYVSRFDEVFYLWLYKKKMLFKWKGPCL